MEDVVALVKALEAEPRSLRDGLARYEQTRGPVLDKLLTAARASAAWHERFPEHMALAPRDFAMSYITRSGRVDMERLREMSPRFVRYVEGGQRA
jgi:2-polyprenyl-6-methoxyphenol hydroxylase-like FAD-dependent oxidoreductase